VDPVNPDPDPQHCKKCGSGVTSLATSILVGSTILLPAEAEEEMTFDCQVEATTIMEGAVNNAPPPPRNLAEKVRKVRPFSCDICNKMFTRIEILRRHLKTHMEDKVPRRLVSFILKVRAAFLNP
jgi:hypothetical protein